MYVFAYLAVAFVRGSDYNVFGVVRKRKKKLTLVKLTSPHPINLTAISNYCSRREVKPSPNTPNVTLACPSTSFWRSLKNSG